MLDNVLKHGYNITCDYGMWHSLVARFVRDEEAAGSNPVIPTIDDNRDQSFMGWSFLMPVLDRKSVV